MNLTERQFIELAESIDDGSNEQMFVDPDGWLRDLYKALKASPASAQEGWKHSCNALCVDGVELWIPQCPHCGKPAPTPPVSEDRWLPIATAPKDRFVLLAGPSGYTTIETVFATGRMCSDYHVGRWIDHANDDLTDWGFEPTHWMPLPKAPAMQEDKP